MLEIYVKVAPWLLRTNCDFESETISDVSELSPWSEPTPWKVIVSLFPFKTQVPAIPKLPV